MSLKNEINDINEFGNYKGVMICSRPGEDLRNKRISPFLSRVHPKDRLGLNPILSKSAQKYHHYQSSNNDYLNRHRIWLDEFKVRYNLQKELKHKKNDLYKSEKFQKIRDMAAKDRQKAKKMKLEFDEMKQKLIKEFKEND